MYKINLYGIERDHLEKQGLEYFYPDEIWDGKSALGKSYA